MFVNFKLSCTVIVTGQAIDCLLSRTTYIYPALVRTKGNVIVLTRNGNENRHSEKSRHSP